MIPAMTKKELAEVAGYSYRRLHDINTELPKDKNLLVKCEGGKFDLALFVQRWIAYRMDAVEEESEELSKVKAQHEKVKKEKTEIEVARMRSEYVPMVDVARAWENVAAIVANRLITLPEKLAPSLVMIDNPDTAEAIIEREVRDMMNMIANTPLPGEYNDLLPSDAEDEDE